MKRKGVTPEVIITAILIGASLQVPSALQLKALESGGASAIPHPKGEVFYVSPAGNDAWSGRRAEPNRANKDGPFATLVRARDVIRALQARQPSGKPVTVYIRGGVYTLTRPLYFLPEDSGTAKCPITYAAYPGEKAVLSGGRTITGWKKAAASGPGNGPEL